MHHETPLWASLALSNASQKSIHLKMEALQPTGSFKIRGVGLLCQEFAEQGRSHFVASSGGNAGLAVAYAGKALGIPVTVYVPETTSPRMRQKIESYGAKVVVEGSVWAIADAAARKHLESEADAAYLHPFDHPTLWRGHNTLVEELAQRSATPPDLIVLSVGGGGLLCGVAEGLARVGWGDVPILAVETHGTASFAAALEEGEPVTLPEVSGIATSLAAGRVADEAYEWSKRRTILSHLVGDEDTLDACRRFLDDHRVLVEPACGAALAPVYKADPVLAPYENIVVIVCGGATMGWEKL